MAITILMVRATISDGREDEFNKWYNEVHAPQVLQYNGAVGVRRYRSKMGEDKYQYMVQYEFASEEIFDEFMHSKHIADLVADYDAMWGTDSERYRTAYVQIWP
jgi:antibiotic biosynthesis monooxygenase (ABM) superfamily enzyme